MQKIIQKLRQKSEEERTHMLHVSVIIFAVLLIILWAYNIGRTITDPDLSRKVKEDFEPLSKLTEDLSEEYKNVSPQNLQGNASNSETNQ